jgi:L-threonylcarbamoyladenylate synthase
MLYSWSSYFGRFYSLAELRKASTESIQEGIALLNKGRLVSFPTDTVYAVGAPINNIGAVRSVYTVKQRPLILAVPLLLAETDDVEKIAVHISETARRLMCRFWPGALTLVFEKTGFVPDIVTAGKQTVAARVAAHPIAIAIIKGAGVPLVGTSANIHGKPSPLTAAEVKAQLNDKVELIIDGGHTQVGIESTIVDVSGDRPRILRQGAVSRAELEAICRID